MSLRAFTPAVRDWFTGAFAGPTAVQEQAWPAIATGEHVLISAPTGSGKTLAAFLWGLDRLVAEPSTEPGVRLVYVSPLKALSHDVERNLRAPLRGIAGGDEARVPTVAIRTGDTPQRERTQMQRTPPDVLITTPESLYLMLTSQARAMLTGVEAVIVDEIHAVAGTKRGSHLALTLERLSALVAAEHPDRDVQRIGLSATQNPLEEVGRFMVGPRRTCTIVDAGVRKPLDLQIHVPVESMVEPDESIDRDPLDPVVGGEATRRSIWPAIYPELLRLVHEHRSTIVFVNNRRAAERLALRLNDLHNEAGDEDGEPQAEREVEIIARAHHGSLAREERLVVEDLLKTGELPCLVATSSLELGIDMGAVDLVLQVESPKSVSRGLQRIGRAGHNVGDVSKGRIFPKFRGDLLECAVVARMMRDGRIEPTVVPRNALDVLAQQIVAIAASAAAPDASSDEEGVVAVDDLYALITRTYSYAELPRELLENVLDMLDGRYPSQEFGDLRPRIVWDRVAGTIRPRKGARALAIVNAGTIPDRGLYSVTLPDGRRVGELDEEMVYEARPGQTFLLGASTWRIEEIQRDRVIVTPAPGAPGAVPFWRGDTIGRPKELGQAMGEFARTAVDLPAEQLERDYDLDPRAARNLLAFLAEQQDATRVIPSDTAIVVERFRDELGDWRVCVLSPYGGRVHAAWGLALSARIRDELGLESDAIWSDDGIIVHLPDADLGVASASHDADAGPPYRAGVEDVLDLILVEPDELEDLVVGELGSSALFGARFRENAGRALLIPRAYPGKRTPLWQQRLKAQSLLEVAKRYGDFPIVLETYRECLRDVLDVPGTIELLRALHRREIALVPVETKTASPFAGSLLFDYVATYMYEGDTPNAERRAAALSLDKDLLRELLGQDELRELIDAGALEQVEADLQHLSERTRATTRDELADVLRRVGDLSLDELRARAHEGVDVAAGLAALADQRRAVLVRVGGEDRWIAADDAGLYRDALGTVPPGGLPAAFVADVPDALRKLVARYARTRGPFTTAELRARYGLASGGGLDLVLQALERDGTLVNGELRPGGTVREWCDADVLRRLRRASLAALRHEIEAADQRALGRFMPSWHGIDRHPPAGAGIDRLRETLVPLQGLALPVETWESEVLPRRIGAYSPTWLDQLCASGEVVWVGSGALGRRSGRVALYFREDAAAIGPPGLRPVEEVDGELHAALRGRLQHAPAFFTDLLAEFVDAAPEALQDALWDLVWAGEVTNDAWAPLRAPRLTLARSAQAAARSRSGSSRRAGTRFASRRLGAQAQVVGRWASAAPLFSAGPADVLDPRARRRTVAELLLERHGIVTREHVVGEGVAGGFSGLYDVFGDLETLGVCRRGYFVEGLGGAQFALPSAVERLRAQKADDEAPPLVLGATDPAQPYGAVLPWPKRDDGETRAPQRVAGAVVVLSGAEPVLYVERGGRSLRVLCAFDDPRLPTALDALADWVRAGRGRKLALEKIDGETVIAHVLEPLLVAAGFRQNPTKLTLSA
ncbi:DEAD/DEAH box helicase [Paraconexibacter algicola]|uniref:DEAD/DEAH box helicase n=1 Tax=Paraconexibacter algicola TaxID=2133960 RepID=A0A2T4UJP7_9ACTN|nr:DEAD/DEAH box helicase [Paraconexibacter algicola]PTL59451.1 DEAD/DEAH box helicase [Paraconexibacter algicola]